MIKMDFKMSLNGTSFNEFLMNENKGLMVNADFELSSTLDPQFMK